MNTVSFQTVDNVTLQVGSSAEIIAFPQITVLTKERNDFYV